MTTERAALTKIEKKQMSSRNSPLKLALSNVFEEEETPVVPQNLDLEWTPIKAHQEQKKPRQNKRDKLQSMWSSNQESGDLEMIGKAIHSEQRLKNSKTVQASMQDQAQIERLLAQKKTLKEVSQYRKRGKIQTQEQETATASLSCLQVSGDHLSIKNKPRRKSPNANGLSKNKAMAHLRKQLNADPTI